jgi:hypothetical protein
LRTWTRRSDIAAGVIPGSRARIADSCRTVRGQRLAGLERQGADRAEVDVRGDAGRLAVGGALDVRAAASRRSRIPCRGLDLVDDLICDLATASARKVSRETTSARQGHDWS